MKKTELSSGWRTFTNPDGSRGGTVHVTATVEDGAWIEPTAIVFPNITIHSDEYVRNGEFRSGDRAAAVKAPTP